MGKCSFNELWLEDERFKSWLQRNKNDPKNQRAHCKLCRVDFSVENMGLHALTSHSKSMKHQSLMEVRKKQQTLSFGFVPPVKAPISSEKTSALADRPSCSR